MSSITNNSLNEVTRLKGDKPLTCIVGAGFAGLLTAIQLTEKCNDDMQVVIIEKPRPQSNTRIAGMRIRARGTGTRTDDRFEQEAEVVSLLSKQNDGKETPEMIHFARLLAEELETWSKRLIAIDPELVHDNPIWFGPQWGIPNQGGKGRGYSILSEFKRLALNMGIAFLQGEVYSLTRQHNLITQLNVAQNRNEGFSLSPKMVILANGNAGGTLYKSTNMPIDHSATQLLYNAGLPITGTTINMLHPFGRMRENGQPAFGCYETDDLANSTVYLPNGQIDTETTYLLRNHMAHDKFREIALRFSDQGGNVRIVDNMTGEEHIAGVSVHYSQLGTVTTDGVSVKGMSNLKAVGDAVGPSYWTNNRKRSPGIALANCLVTARLASDLAIESLNDDKDNNTLTNRRLIMSKDTYPQALQRAPEGLRDINTRNVLELILGGNEAQGTLDTWDDELNTLDQGNELVRLSHALIRGWNRKIRGENEPITIVDKEIGKNIEGNMPAEDFSPLRYRL